MKHFGYFTIGLFALLATIGLNLQHAANDYGVLNNKLHVEVLAQSNNSGGGGNNSGGFTIICNNGDYGVCQYCRRNSIYNPNYGWGYTYECQKTGDPEDWCSSGCNSNGGGSFSGSY